MGFNLLRFCSPVLILLALNSCGLLDGGGEDDIIPPSGPPGAPVLATPANIATGVDTNPTLSWNAAPEATWYHLQVSTDAAFGVLVVDKAGLTATSYALSGLVENAHYYWRVNAANAGGSGPYSAPWTFKTHMRFSFPATVGGSWVYRDLERRWSQKYAGPKGYYYVAQEHFGIQTWVVGSRSVQGSDTLVYLSSTKRDTLHEYRYYWNFDQSREVVYDTTIVLPDTTIHFTMALSRESISINFRSTLFADFYTDRRYVSNIEYFNRIILGGSDTVRTSNSLAEAIYVSGEGLTRFYNDGQVGVSDSYGYHEELHLLR